MRTLSLLKGMPVYSAEGNILGEVCDLGISDEGKIKCLLIKTKKFFNNLYRLPIYQVESYGDNGIVLRNESNLEKFKEQEEEYTLCHSNPLLKKLTISKSGDQLGLLEDVYFIEEVGTIIGYELTDGFFTDIFEGKKVVQTNNPPEFGKDAIIVSVNHMRGGVTYDKMSKLPK
ncbi:PRC-barrel domain-containing protein [Heyndrickxia sp. NPDC080065]|uniref:PRC-barrel domain-containing protein n=1 Tax=Heyndrickxia sp. NPDC080065 TaxID=3390568 RepID=UPI003CFEB91D